MRRFIASAVAAIFLSSTLAYSQGSGPYSAQIQRAIASLTAGNVNFTQLQCNGSTGTSGQVLTGGNPCTWTGSPSITKLLVGDGTAAAPSLTFANNTNSGIINVTGSPEIVANGTKHAAFGLAVTGIEIPVAGAYAFSSTSDPGASADVLLVRDAANTLALHNGTNAQQFNIYGTFTDASNYERLKIGSGAGPSYILTEAAGSGTQRGLVIGTVGSQVLNFRVNNADVWQVNTSGNLVDQGIHTITAGSTISGARYLSATAAPGLSSCGTGSIDANSTDAGGKVTATGATACTVTFTVPYPTAAWCTITDDTTIGKGLISAQSNSAFTVSSLTSGDTFTYTCNGK